MILAKLRDIMILQRVAKSFLINFNTKFIQFCLYFSKIFGAMKINILISCQNHPDFTQIRQILDSQKYRNWLISNFGIDIETQFRNSGIWYRNWKPYIVHIYICWQLAQVNLIHCISMWNFRFRILREINFRGSKSANYVAFF